jgi:hypothetical protein
MAELKAWQQRVIAEREQLIERLLKCEAWLADAASEGRENAPATQLLRVQHEIMCAYKQVLGERIRLFQPE